ncbi:glycosyltransferase family 2 protein [Leptothoe sp. PORK10 BA2]|uniref:glycosyltransferase family 2 protein n=1 Tax=Leptothoe sp. PORK10 BA2 TaxID=3110254 RepID=UPI002B2178FD|nr:glycosyltransferase [Leptothoe sp. PORK10 BA2]MEA5464942.1 glycosyltransferase [Leptothoe sp. PORK10 BA2]
MNNALLSPCTLPKARLQPASITLVVVANEHFSYAQKSLESIYKHTKIPFELVYVDAGSPKYVQNYLIREATQKGFTLLRTNHFLSPNQARNIGLSRVTTDYVVFINNDIHVSPGWLGSLWQCAKETDATIVCPLTCVGKPLHDRVYMAGGEARVFTAKQNGQTHRRLYEKHFLANRKVSIIKHQLYRRTCEFAELSCLLVRRDIFEQVGYLDEKLLSSQQDMDFCLSVAQVGGRMFCEPTSVVTHSSEASYHWSDMAYAMLRWSDAWEVESLMHFQQKWELDMDQYFIQRYKQLGHRRQQLLNRLSHQLTGDRQVPWLEKCFLGLDHRLNQVISDHYTRRSSNTLRQVIPITEPLQLNSKHSGGLSCESFNQQSTC